METIRLKNYRCFFDTEEIKMKPVNILLGKNSVGKSSFLKFFPLLKQSRMKNPNGIFLWYADDVDFKDFKNTVKNGEGNIEIDIKYLMPLTNFDTSSKSRKKQTEEVTVAFTISGHPKDENLDYLSRLHISYADISIDLEFNLPDDKNFFHPLKSVSVNNHPFDVPAGIIPQLTDDVFLPTIFFKSGENENLSYTSHPEIEQLKDIHKIIKEVEDAERIIPRRFSRSGNYSTASELTDVYNKLPKKISKQFKTAERFIEILCLQDLNNIIRDINDYIEDLTRSIHYIQPVRANAKRYYRLQNLAVDEIDSHGDNLPMYLNSLSSGAKQRLNKWIEPLFKFKLDVSAKEGHIQILIIETGDNEKERENSVVRNLVDVGFGYSQLLPIIVQIWNALSPKDSKRHLMRRRDFNNPSIIVIEQPELHLHPRMMTYFAEMLILMIKENKNNVRFIIETHSETLIESLGRKIARINSDSEKGLLIDPEAFQILIFNKENDSSSTSIMATQYNENGFIEKWPYGFFSGEK